MGAVAERQSWGAYPTQPELFGIVEDGRITVGGRDDNENLLAGQNLHAANELILDRGAGGGTGIAQGFTRTEEPFPCA